MGWRGSRDSVGMEVRHRVGKSHCVDMYECNLGEKCSNIFSNGSVVNISGTRLNTAQEPYLLLRSGFYLRLEDLIKDLPGGLDPELQ